MLKLQFTIGFIVEGGDIVVDNLQVEDNIEFTRGSQYLFDFSQLFTFSFKDNMMVREVVPFLYDKLYLFINPFNQPSDALNSELLLLLL